MRVDPGAAGGTLGDDGLRGSAGGGEYEVSGPEAGPVTPQGGPGSQAGMETEFYLGDTVAFTHSHKVDDYDCIFSLL